MKGWSGSLVVLGATFASAVAITVGPALLVVQDRATSTAESTETPAPTIAADAVPTGTGASLTVSGERESTIALDRDAYDVSIQPDFERGSARVVFGRYSLRGEAGAIHFVDQPLAVEQIDLDGLAFYPEPDECTITPAQLNSDIGVASARLQCPDLTDIRETGTFTIEGGIALPADLLGMRGDLPPAGGRVEVGGQSIEFSDGRMLVQDVFVVETERQPLFLYGDDDASSLGFERDPQTGDFYLTYLVVGEQQFDIADDACDVPTEELGRLNPITTVLELSIQCDELDLGDLGEVAIDATLVVDLILQSEFTERP